MPESQNEQELKQEALTVIEQSKSIKITDNDSYNVAADLLINTIKPMRKRWAAYWEGVKKPAYAAYQAVQGKFNEGDKPLAEAEDAIKGEIRRFETEQAKIREQKQREAQAKAEHEAEEKRIQDAAMAEEFGASEEEVQAIASAPVVVVAAPVEPAYTRAAGVSLRDNFKCRVKDLKALCKAIGAGKASVTYVVPNQSALDSRAKADQLTMNIPGCEPYNDKTVAGRTK